MIFRLHSTPEINVPDLILHLIEMNTTNPERAQEIFHQGFKSIPMDVIVGVLSQKIPVEKRGDKIIISSE